ncbi:sugar kinase [Tepidibacillus fermentans]|uniref:5-dehydro-2-deoxygluconokinase n=1 Tax=Tepidibacillus fermentans TaxID=1281767 RepID=A0A4R3K8Q0_9BACI|nr:sugar kinase [Tepidibacillus fermentans]TCS79394.1 5-dehydro-2-deoxygluconokinase [Tepidibacillus fermentans]
MDVVTVGETMVLMTPDSSGPMRYANEFMRKFAGAESNLAIGLARLGHQVGWISRVGKDEFGKAMVSFIRGEGVDVSQVKVDDSAPTGLYFKEFRRANDLRVYYYRKNSAASKLSPVDLNEEYIASAKFLHITGITPALSDSCYEMIFSAIEMAKKHSVKVVFDPNLRRKLWDEGKARETFLKIASQADIVLPGLDEGEFMFGEKDVEKLGKLFIEHGSAIVVIKTGADGAFYFTNDDHRFVPGFPVAKVVDPVGAGDGFAAGFISGLLDELSLYEAVKRGNALGAFAVTVNGDVEGLPDRDELFTFFNEKSNDVSR